LIDYKATPSTVTNRRDENILEATEEPYREEEDSTGRSRYQIPGSTPEQRSHNGACIASDTSYKKLTQLSIAPRNFVGLPLCSTTALVDFFGS